MVPSINHSTAAAVLLASCVVRDRLAVHDFMRADGDYLLHRACLTNHGRDCRLGEQPQSVVILLFGSMNIFVALCNCAFQTYIAAAT